MEPLKKVQVEGFLMSADVQELFGNLDELCYVSYTFCKDFLASLLKDMGPTCFGSTAALISAFERLTKHSRNGEVYHRYCLNYSNALAHLENVRKQHEEFGEFDKWCSQDPRCNRLQLTDLLVAPMQHWTKMPLLLKEIRKYTENTEERMQLTESIEDVEKSLEQLNDKMKWVKNFERVLEIQHQIVWPSISETDPKSFIPEFLKSTLSQQPCERLLASPKRHLMYEGPVTLVEQSKGQEMYIFLFDDIFLLTKLKKSHRKKTSVVDQNPNNYKADASPGTYTVYRQPISLDRFSLHDVGPAEAQANGLKNAFVIVQITRFQQIVGIYTFQAPSETAKAAWLDNLREAKEKYNGDRNASRHNSFKENLNPSNTGAVSQTLTVTPQLVPDSRNSPRLVKKRSEMRRIHERSQTIDMSGYGTLPKSFVQHKTKSVDSVYL
ncbi:pleckstrin homology domain-containing family G member 7 [Lingula anatina]|nr:pleckstrin homology domain-containing family G member 7 [Lingula anatina]|eukprot:XP_013405668.1 pleckstrin homology domain-containing family G member 7 [Lingula anatina]